VEVACTSFTSQFVCKRLSPLLRVCLFVLSVNVRHLLILAAVDGVFYKPKGQILVGASARGYKFGNTVVRRACVTVAAESESLVNIEASDPVDVNDDLADGLVASNSSIGKSSEFFGRLKSYSISFKSAVAEKLSATSNTSENSHELCDLGFVDSSEHTRDNAFVTEIQPSGNSLMSNMMTKALQAAASVASDYRGSSVSSTSSLPSGAPPSAESLTSTLSCVANELRELVASSASSSITTHYYQNVTKLVRGRLAGIIPVYLHIHLLYARIHFA